VEAAIRRPDVDDAAPDRGRTGDRTTSGVDPATCPIGPDGTLFVTTNGAVVAIGP